MHIRRKTPSQIRYSRYLSCDISDRIDTDTINHWPILRPIWRFQTLVRIWQNVSSVTEDMTLYWLCYYMITLIYQVDLHLGVFHLSHAPLPFLFYKQEILTLTLTFDQPLIVPSLFSSLLLNHMFLTSYSMATSSKSTGSGSFWGWPQRSASLSYGAKFLFETTRTLRKHKKFINN